MQYTNFNRLPNMLTDKFINVHIAYEEEEYNVHLATSTG